MLKQSVTSVEIRADLHHAARGDESNDPHMTRYLTPGSLYSYLSVAGYYEEERRYISDDDEPVMAWSRDNNAADNARKVSDLSLSLSLSLFFPPSSLPLNKQRDLI